MCRFCAASSEMIKHPCLKEQAVSLTMKHFRGGFRHWQSTWGPGEAPQECRVYQFKPNSGRNIEINFKKGAVT